MALQRMILVPPELWENRSLPPPPFKKIIKSKDHNYNKWTKIRLHQDPHLKTEKRKREPIPVPIIQTGDVKRKYNWFSAAVQNSLIRKLTFCLRIQSALTMY